MKNALLFLTHIWNGRVEREFAARSAAPGVDTWLLLDSRTPAWPQIVSQVQRAHVFDVARLLLGKYPVIATRGLKGNGHLPILDFWSLNRSYDFYWVSEYDVRYSGEWGKLIGRYKDCQVDFITAHVREYADEPLWKWWRTIETPLEDVPMRSLLRSFNVFYRISNSALAFLDRELPRGWRGHHEVLVASLLKIGGFAVQDFGGDGSYTPRGDQNSIYRSCSSIRGDLSGNTGTLRFRPPWPEAGTEPGMLYHPVK
jgi:hypothetical protein